MISTIRIKFITILNFIVWQITVLHISYNQQLLKIIQKLKEKLRMKKLLIMILCCISLSFGLTTTAIAEESVAGIDAALDNIHNGVFITLYTTDRVNLRKEPTTNSDIILTLDKRTEVRMITSSDKWVKVLYGDTFGYLYKDYVTDVKPFTSKENRWGIELTDDEIDLLAKIVWTEARSQSDDGEVAVCEVIFNRMVALQYPDTLIGVLSDGDAFASWDLRNKATPTEREYEIIEETLRGETDILSLDVMYFSTTPRNDNVEAHIGGHFFCKEAKDGD
jgi:uncharacterized protein YgiM (DUF1202 family)